MSKNDAKLFPSTKVLTGISLQHRGKLNISNPSPYYHNKQKYAKYEIMI